MKNKREKVIIKTSIISIVSNIVLATFKAFVGVHKNYKDYKLNITLDLDISD